MAKTKDSDTPSMEEILQTIRGVISGDGKDEEGASAEDTSSTEDSGNDDILDLTQMVEEDGSVTTLTPTANENTPKAEEETATDVLQDIDSALQPATAQTDSEEASDKDDMPVSEESEETPDEDDMLVSAEPEATPDENDMLVSEESEKTPDENDMLVSEESEEVIVAEAPVNDVAEAELPEDDSKKTSRLISEQTATASTKALESLLQSVPKTQVDGPSFRTGVTLEDLVIEAMKPELSTWLDKNLPSLVTNLVEKEIKKLLPSPDDD